MKTLVAAALVSAAAAQAATIYEAPSGAPDTSRPIGEMAFTGLLTGPDQGYRATCNGSQCAYGWLSGALTPASAQSQTWSFSISYVPMGATLRSLNIWFAGDVTGAAGSYYMASVHGSVTVRDAASGEVLGHEVSTEHVGFGLRLQGLESQGVTITGQLTVRPGREDDDWQQPLQSYAYGALEFTQAGPVPEPLQAGLWIAGLAAIGGLARRHSTHR